MNQPAIIVTSSAKTGAERSSEIEASYHAAMIASVGADAVISRTDWDPARVIDEYAASGVLLSGGGDIAPARYGGDENLATERVDLQRDAFEFTLLHEALSRSLPIFAVCRGMQLVNVYFGGDLIEDLRMHFGSAYRISHHQLHDADLQIGEYSHPVVIDPGSKLHTIIQTDRCMVNSYHHQAIRRVAPALRIVARSEDDIPEAMESFGSANGFLIGVEWHPELNPDDPVTQHLYRAFIEACKR